MGDQFIILTANNKTTKQQNNKTTKQHIPQKTKAPLRRGFRFIQMIKMVVGYRLWVVGVFVGLAYNRHPHSNRKPTTYNQ